MGRIPFISHVYDLLGNLAQVRRPNGVVSDYDYDGLNRLEFLREFRDINDNHGYDAGVDAVLAEYDYDLAPDGQRTGVTERTRVDAVLQETQIDWLYDDLGRLIRETYAPDATNDDYTADYVYDLVGNRRTKTTDKGNDSTVDETVTYDYDANDRLLTETKDAAGTANDTTTVYEYGPGATASYANGQWTVYGGDWTQQTAKTVYDSSHSPLATDHYSYNLQGRMASAEVKEYDGGTLQSHTKSEYTYDDNGIRVTQTVRTDVNKNGSFGDAEDTTVATNYLNDANNPTGYSQVLEEKVSGNVTKSYTLGLDVVAQQAPAIASGGNLFLLCDGHGSTRGLVDAAGQPLSGQVFRYDAFGNRLDSNGALTSLLYSGEQTDGTGLQYLRARYYDPAVGRFNRLDDFAGRMNDPQSLHKYLYTHGNPITGVDPSGRMLGGLGSFFAATTFRAAMTSLPIGVATGAVSKALGASFVSGFVGGQTIAVVALATPHRLLEVLGKGLASGVSNALGQWLTDPAHSQRPLTLSVDWGSLGRALLDGFAWGAASAAYGGVVSKWFNAEDEIVPGAIVAMSVSALKDLSGYAFEHRYRTFEEFGK